VGSVQKAGKEGKGSWNPGISGSERNRKNNTTLLINYFAIE